MHCHFFMFGSLGSQAITWHWRSMIVAIAARLRAFCTDANVWMQAGSTWRGRHESSDTAINMLSSPPRLLPILIIVPLQTPVPTPPLWLTRDQLTDAHAPLTLEWLFHPDSLTRRLTRLSADAFSVQPLTEGVGRQAGQAASQGVGVEQPLQRQGRVTR